MQSRLWIATALAALLTASAARAATTYVYDDLGRLVQATYDSGNQITYTYDARGRLTNVSHAGSVNNNLQANYTYDKADNRETVNVTGSPN